MQGETTATLPSRAGKPLWAKLLAGFVVLLALLALLIAFFPWDVLRGPLNRYVSEKTGRHFEITRKLDVKLGRTTRILADGIEFANPEWAKDPFLVKAEGAEIGVRLWPLLRRKIELPLVELRKPQLGLQIEEDGRRSWALGRDTSDPGNFPDIGAFVVDEGSLHFVALHEGADIRTEFKIDGPLLGTAAKTQTQTHAGADLPLSFKAKGTWQKEAFTAEGRTGNVLFLSQPLQQPFPAEVHLTAAQTTLRANGSVASLATLDGADANFSLQGPNLAELYKLVGVVLPETPRYALKGHLSKQGEVWRVRQINGNLGNSDLTGELAFDQSHQVPLLTGAVQSKSLDFDDLAPLVGLPEQARSAAAMPQVAGTTAADPKKQARRVANAAGPARKVLPTAQLDVARLKAMDADVRYNAVRISNVQQLPLDSMKLRVVLKAGVLNLNDMDLGVAGGKLAGKIRIDGNPVPAVAQINLDARALELNKLFPGFKLTQASFGKIHGDIDLRGRGNSVAQMLGTSSGNVAMLMGKGEISNLLLEFAGLDGGEIIKFLLGGDRTIQLRCAATAFDVRDGLMTTRALMVDTSDTVVHGSGTISLATEQMDLTLRPQPKDASILSLRSPLKLAGSFAQPKAGIDKGALAGRAGAALALAAVNPLLALAATIETGPGKDADCGAALREASGPGGAAALAKTAPTVPATPAGQPKGRTVLGGPAAVQTVPSNGPDYPLERKR